LTLEELDQVFSVSTAKHAAYQWRQVTPWILTNLFREKEEENNNNEKVRESLYPWERPNSLVKSGLSSSKGFTEQISNVA
jgi:hypothetical protein